MKAKLYNQDGKEIKNIELPEEVFGLKFNNDLVHQVFVAQYSNARKPWAHAKIREEVSGGGKKPWRQKGTGRARHGSIRSPLWKGGGVTFGPRNEKDYHKKVNKKMKKKALFMILSQKNKEGFVAFVDDLDFGEAKTKNLHKIMAVFAKNVFNIPVAKKIIGKKILMVTPQKNKIIERAAGNIPWIHLISADSLNVGDILMFKYILMFEASIESIKKIFFKKNTK